MPALYPIRPPKIPPVGPVMADRRDPVVAGMLAAYLPNQWNGLRNLVGLGGDQLVMQSAGGIAISGAGRSMASLTTAQGASVAIGASSPLSFTGSLSLMWYGMLIGDPIGTNPGFIGVSFDNADSFPFISYEIERRGGTSAEALFSYNSTGGTNAGQLDWAAAIPASYGFPFSLILSAAASGTVKLYSNGVDQGVGTLNSGINFDGTQIYSSTSLLNLTCYPAVNTRAINGYTSLGAIWNRALTAQEVGLLAADPYRFLTPRNRPRFPRMPVELPSTGFQPIMPAY